MDNGTHSLLTITNFEADNMGVYQCRAIVDTTITSGDVTDGNKSTFVNMLILVLYFHL